MVSSNPKMQAKRPFHLAYRRIQSNSNVCRGLGLMSTDYLIFYLFFNECQLKKKKRVPKERNVIKLCMLILKNYRYLI